MGRKQKIENREAILRASYHLFITQGYDMVSVRDIENESKVQTRNFYRYFKNKDDILSAVIEAVDKKMLEYLNPILTDNPLLTFVLFITMKYEYSILYPDYFRMRGSLIERPNAFIKSFMELYELSYPQIPNWKSDEHTMLQGLYVLGGMLMVQYGFIKNVFGEVLSDDSGDFLKNNDKHELSEDTANSFKRFMDYAIRTNLHIFDLSDKEIDNLLEDACTRLAQINIKGFRNYYEDALGFI